MERTAGATALMERTATHLVLRPRKEDHVTAWSGGAAGTDPPDAGPSPPGWEDVCETACGLCFRLGADDTGLCQFCRERLPRVGGCGKAVAVVTAVAGEGETDAPLAHLIGCTDSRTFFAALAELERCADMEAPHAAGRPITAA